jgi:hypothetical protein
VGVVLSEVVVLHYETTPGAVFVDIEEWKENL